MNLNSRFISSFIANFLKATIAFATGLLIARGLGPDLYGSLIFLMGSFGALRLLFDMGSSSAFFTFVSQKERSSGFYKTYFKWLVVQFVLPLLCLAFLLPSEWVMEIWHGEKRSTLIMAFSATFMQSAIWPLILQIGESQRRTLIVQSISLTVALIHLLFILLAWYSDWLDINLIFILISIEWLCASIYFFYSVKILWVNRKDSYLSILKEYWQYCFPLLPYTLVGFIYEFSDKWLLQTLSGSREQAYFGVALQFSVVAAIATTSILNIFWKEIAEHHYNSQLVQIGYVYNKIAKILFFISASFVGFLLPWSEELILITLGRDYLEGTPTFMIMLFFPLYQCIGQLGSTIAYATGETGLQSRIGILFMIISISSTYFLLASSENFIPGLGLGSKGLALKLVLLQFIQANILLFLLSKKFAIKINWQYQPVILIACLLNGYLSWAISTMAFHALNNSWIIILLSGVIYTIISLILLIARPKTFGFNRSQLEKVWLAGKNCFNK